MKGMTRCPHCGGEYHSAYPSHCMANFTEGAQRTELLGRYCERAERAEAAIEDALSGLRHIRTHRTPNNRDVEDLIEILQRAMICRSPQATDTKEGK